MTGIDEAFHGLDAARRAGWAKYYAAEEAIADRDDELTQLRMSLGVAWFWLLMHAPLERRALHRLTRLVDLCRLEPDITYLIGKEIEEADFTDEAGATSAWDLLTLIQKRL